MVQQVKTQMVILVGDRQDIKCNSLPIRHAIWK